MSSLSKPRLPARATSDRRELLGAPRHSRFYLLLVIIKDAASRWQVSKSLREHGFAVTNAESFQEALDMTSVLQPDVVLADVEPIQSERRVLSEGTPLLLYPLAELLALTEEDSIKPALRARIDHAIRSQYPH